MKKLIFIFSILLLFFSFINNVFSAEEDTIVELSVSNEEVIIDEVFTLKLIIKQKNAQMIDSISIDGIDNFIIHWSSKESTNIQMINDDIFAIIWKEYSISSDKEWIYDIWPATIWQWDQAFTSNSLNIKISDEPGVEKIWYEEPEWKSLWFIFIIWLVFLIIIWVLLHLSNRFKILMNDFAKKKNRNKHSFQNQEANDLFHHNYKDDRLPIEKDFCKILKEKFWLNFDHKTFKEIKDIIAEKRNQLGEEKSKKIEEFYFYLNMMKYSNHSRENEYKEKLEKIMKEV